MWTGRVRVGGSGMACSRPRGGLRAEPAGLPLVRRVRSPGPAATVRSPRRRRPLGTRESRCPQPAQAPTRGTLAAAPVGDAARRAQAVNVSFAGRRRARTERASPGAHGRRPGLSLPPFRPLSYSAPRPPQTRSPPGSPDSLESSRVLRLGRAFLLLVS